MNPKGRVVGKRPKFYRKPLQKINGVVWIKNTLQKYYKPVGKHHPMTMLINMMSKAINLLLVLIWKNVLELAKKNWTLPHVQSKNL